MTRCSFDSFAFNFRSFNGSQGFTAGSAGCTLRLTGFADAMLKASLVPGMAFHCLWLEACVPAKRITGMVISPERNGVSLKW